MLLRLNGGEMLVLSLYFRGPARLAADDRAGHHPQGVVGFWPG
jgi:hypothetical protein